MDVNKEKFTIVPGSLKLSDLQMLMHGNYKLVLESSSKKRIIDNRKFLEQAVENGERIYGVNTGFGLLAKKVIDQKDLTKLQENLILSHSVGVGDYLLPEIVRLILVLKINSLSMACSGIRLETIYELIDLYNNDTLPCIPEKGSVGASGDLAPLAHLVSPLLGYGNILFNNKIISADKWLKLNDKNVYEFKAKEGLALLNGTQVTTALAIYSLFNIKQLFKAGLYIGAMSVDACGGSRKPFCNEVSRVRNQKAQIKVAKTLYELLDNSEIMESHAGPDCPKVQDPYSIRCQPQVMGACLAQIEFAETILNDELNSVTDNPLIFDQSKQILFGGNFHAEPIGFVADNLALVVAEIGSIAERRMELLVDKHFSGLPGFLVKNGGLNSGFMIAQVTAASLVSENRALATPTVVDSIPTSANQEDHVSMATYGARRLISMVDNCSNILAIELLAAAQGIEFKRPLRTSKSLEDVISSLRKHVEFYDADRYFHQDIVFAKKFVSTYEFTIKQPVLCAEV